MNERDSKQLVIDTDVARSAGGESATHPRAIKCRDFLSDVKQQNHKIVMTRQINDEWKRNQSRFARRWRLSMDARKKIVRINLSEDEQLRDKITTTTHDENEIETMEKDIHLLEAALETDKTVISLDQTVRTLFAQASQQVGEIREIIWVNPDRTEEEQPIAWLKNGAPPEAHRQLAAYPIE